MGGMSECRDGKIVFDLQLSLKWVTYMTTFLVADS